jgi:hypothetical protein
MVGVLILTNLLKSGHFSWTCIEDLMHTGISITGVAGGSFYLFHYSCVPLDGPDSLQTYLVQHEF